MLSTLSLKYIGVAFKVLAMVPKFCAFETNKLSSFTAYDKERWSYRSEELKQHVIFIFPPKLWRPILVMPSSQEKNKSHFHSSPLLNLLERLFQLTEAKIVRMKIFRQMLKNSLAPRLLVLREKFREGSIKHYLMSSEQKEQISRHTYRLSLVSPSSITVHCPFWRGEARKNGSGQFSKLQLLTSPPRRRVGF